MGTITERAVDELRSSETQLTCYSMALHEIINNNQETGKKIKDITAQSIESTMDKKLQIYMDTYFPEKLKNAFKALDISELQMFRKEFHDVMTDIFDPPVSEIGIPINKFIWTNMNNLLEDGFVNLSATFTDYRELANDIVKRLYQAKRRNRLSMICLYTPMQYLIMMARGTLKYKNIKKPDHLLVFNGIDIDTYSPFKRPEETTEQTEVARILYLPKAYIKDFNNKHSTTYKIRSEYIFSYILFCLLNSHIKLYWRFKERNVVADTGLVNGESNEQDFMIVDETYFIRYKKKKESLHISWDWHRANSSVARSRVMPIFRKCNSLFRDLPEIPNVPSTENKNANEDRTAAGYYISFFEMMIEGGCREIAVNFSKQLVEVLQIICNSDYKNDGFYVFRNDICRPVLDLLEKADLEKDDFLLNIEYELAEIVKNNYSDHANHKKVLSFLFGKEFSNYTESNFNNLFNDEMAIEILPELGPDLLH